MFSTETDDICFICHYLGSLDLFVLELNNDFNVVWPAVQAHKKYRKNLINSLRMNEKIILKCFAM